MRIFIAILCLFALYAPALAELEDTWVGTVRGLNAHNITVFNPDAKQATSFTIDPGFDNVTSYSGQKMKLSDVKPGMKVSVHFIRRQVLSLQHVSGIVILPAGSQSTPLPIPSYSYAPATSH